MKQKVAVFQNKGMTRDLSISKQNNEFAFENFNIRITARDNDTLLSVTNERGNIPLVILKENGSTPEDKLILEGTLLGYSVLNNDLILFTKSDTDHIYRVSYHIDNSWTGIELFNGVLNFSIDYPIETLSFYESEDIKKIYWVDGLNQPRVINFASIKDTIVSDDIYTKFDFVTSYDNSNLQVSIDKEYSSVGVPSGVRQYFITYYNKYGQETHFIYSSPLYYNAFQNRGAAPDESTFCLYKINLKGLDSTFQYVRVYSLTWTSLSTQPSASIVGESIISDGTATIIDNGVPLESIDPTQILYLGGDKISAYTIAQKDNTLFLGNVTEKSVSNWDDIDSAIKESCFDTSETEGEFVEGVTWKSSILKFKRSSDVGYNLIESPKPEGQYPYYSQLQYPSNEIKSFKRGERYRFALRFVDNTGNRTKAFWIGDLDNNITPHISQDGIDRVVVECKIPEAVLNAAKDYKEVELLMAKTSISDRSIICQGILCPTVFNLLQRYGNKPFSSASWIMRPRNSNIPSLHFTALNDSKSLYSEIQNNNYPEGKSTITPFYDESYKVDNALIGIKFILSITQRNTGWNATWYTLEYKVATQNNPTGSGSKEIFGCSATGRYKAYQHLQANWEARGLPLSYLINYADFDRIVNQILPPYLGDKTVIVTSDNITDIEPNPTSLDDLNFQYFGNSVDGKGYQYSTENQEFFFVDENIITLNSPELEDNISAIDNNKSLKLRIVGIAPVTANYTGYKADITAGHMISSKLAEYNLSNENISDNTEGLLSYPLWWDNTPEENKTNSWTNNQTMYMMYMWHKTGSIIGDTSETKYATLNSKLFANERFCYRTIFADNLNNDPELPKLEYNLDSLRIYDSSELSLVQIDVDSEVKSYQGNCNFVVTKFLNNSTEDNSYPVYTTGNYNYNDYQQFTDSILTEGYKSSDPINIKYKTTPHAVMSFSPLNGKHVLLPWCFNYEKLKFSSIEDQDSLYYYFPWKFYGITKTDENTKYLYSGNNTPYIEFLSDPIIDNNTITGIIDGDKDEIVNILNSFSLSSTIYGLTKDFNLFYIKDNGKIYLDSSAKITIDGASLKGEVKDGYPYIETIYDENISKYTVTVNYSTSEKEPVEVIIDNISKPSSGNVLSMQIPVEVGDYSFSLSFYASSNSLENSDVWTSDTIELDVPAIGIDNWSSTPRPSKSCVLKDAPIIADPLFGKEQTSLYNIENGSIYLLYKEGDTFVIDTQESPIYEVLQDQIKVSEDLLGEPLNQYPYVFIGELYRDFDTEDSRYGGITSSALENNTFIVCSDTVPIESASIIGKEGDTYIQRYDCLKTYPYSDNDENQVTDITSVILETHINLDGRYDLNRQMNPVDINYQDYIKLNTVYSQENSFIPGIVLDEKFNTSTHPTQIIWSESKSLSEDIDTWTGIHLASYIDMDGDKGPIRAIRRFQNSIIAFQDKGIAEVLFNTRTQLSTTQGIPIEIANSGKVDGKRYITDKSGCLNKWSIVETGNGIYFIDNINSSISVFNGSSIQSLSDIRGFKNWIGANNSTDIWNPRDFNNFVAYWDRVNDDVYFIKKNKNQYHSTLCYNEQLQQFTSFFNYGQVPMMVNIQDRFISFRDNSLWEHNSGEYSNLFGEKQDFYILYRITPDPYGDKIFSNIEYRADMFNMSDLNEDNPLYSEGVLTNNTFNTLEVWNEYQGNSVDLSFNFKDSYPDVRRKFRIWRADIPRDRKKEDNPYGLNRIRNPWIYLKLTKNTTNDTNERMEFHDLLVRYYE